jgi:hypothetical protein
MFMFNVHVPSADARSYQITTSHPGRGKLRFYIRWALGTRCVDAT